MVISHEKLFDFTGVAFNVNSKPLLVITPALNNLAAKPVVYASGTVSMASLVFEE
jgi:hypothetical protein